MIGFLEAVGSFVAGTLVPFLFLLALIVFVHEFGHFIVARWCGVGVRTFSIGFGPELIGRTDRKGTRWRISAIPLGGYVRFVGDENIASAAGRAALDRLAPAERRVAFAAQPVARRAAIVVAGPLANLLLAIVIFAALFSAVGQQVSPARIDSVLPDTPAAAAGFEAGDLITEIDGTPIESFADLQRIVSTNAGIPLSVTVERDGAAVPLAVTPETEEVVDEFGNAYRRGLIGIAGSITGDELETVRYGVPAALWRGVEETWFVIDTTFTYVGRIIRGTESADQLGGPISVARVAGEAASIGFLSLLSLAAYVSISIGLVNLFPIPLLDGGHLMFYAYEALRGRPLSDRAQEVGFRLGFMVVLMLLIFATWNDVT